MAHYAQPLDRAREPAPAFVPTLVHYHYMYTLYALRV